MATVTVIKAVSRSRGGKGAARAERRAGRVPGIIYGDGKPPLPSIAQVAIRTEPEPCRPSCSTQIRFRCF